MASDIALRVHAANTVMQYGTSSTLRRRLSEIGIQVFLESADIASFSLQVRDYTLDVFLAFHEVDQLLAEMHVPHESDLIPGGIWDAVAQIPRRGAHIEFGSFVQKFGENPGFIFRAPVTSKDWIIWRNKMREMKMSPVNATTIRMVDASHLWRVLVGNRV